MNLFYILKCLFFYFHKRYKRCNRTSLFTHLMLLKVLDTLHLQIPDKGKKRIKFYKKKIFLQELSPPHSTALTVGHVLHFLHFILIQLQRRALTKEYVNNWKRNDLIFQTTLELRTFGFMASFSSPAWRPSKSTPSWPDFLLCLGK